MNALAHAELALKAFKNEKLSREQKDQLIVGTIIPDVPWVASIDHHRTHTEGLQFLNTLPQEYFPFGAGVVLHGERPAGVDHFSHHYKEGYVHRKRDKVLKKIRKFKQYWRGVSPNLAAHVMTEFSVDYFLAKKRVINRVSRAFKNKKIHKPTKLFWKHFKIPNDMHQHFASKHVHKFFHTFRTQESLSEMWSYFMFFKSKGKVKICTMWDKMKLVAQLGAHTLQHKFRRQRGIEDMFSDVQSEVEKDYKEFMSDTQEKLIALKEELYQKKPFQIVPKKMHKAQYLT